MPMFGLPFTLDDNERRRGMAPINPDAQPPVTLPSMPMPTRRTPMPLGDPSINPVPNVPIATPPITPREASLPEFRPRMTRVDELSGAKDEYMAKTPGRFRSGLVNALRGFASGLQTGGGLGAGLGGALAGGAFGAINPRGAREQEFERYEQPRIFERFAMEDQETATRRAAEKTLRDEEMYRADIALKESQALKNRMPELPRPVGPEWMEAVGEDGQPIVVDMNAPANRGKVFRPYVKPTSPSRADEVARIEAALTDEEGTVENISQGSLRGRLESLKQRLTPEEQRLVFGGVTRDDDPQAVARAQSKWAKIQEEELNSIRRDTGERRKAKVSQRRFGRKGQPGRTAISVSEAADLLK